MQTQQHIYVELARKAIKGDLGAFEEIIRKKQRRFLFSAINILKNEADAEDAVQDAILKMFRNIGKLKSPVAVSSWMDTIVRNECYRIYSAAKPQMSDVDLDDDDSDAAAAIIEEDHEFLPEEYATDKELNERLYEMVLSLSPAKREAILMYYYQGLSYNEMVEMTGTTASSVSVNLTKARAELRKILRGDASLLGDDKMKAIAAIPAIPAANTVMGRALEARSISLFPDEKLADFEHRWADILQSELHPARKSYSKAIISAVAVAVVFIGIVVGISFLGDSGTGSGASEIGREIVFVSDDVGYGNYNPKSVGLGNLADGDVATGFTIATESGEIIFSGDTEDAAEAEILRMESAHEDGDYILGCELKDKNGNQVVLERKFTIEIAG
jgi:RNA polymerase sigma-70 factor (ECF subfamily)